MNEDSEDFCSRYASATETRGGGLELLKSLLKYLTCLERPVSIAIGQFELDST